MKKPTKEQLKKLENAFSYDATFAEACTYADYSVSDFNLWLVDNQDYRKKFEALRHTATLKARKSVIDGFADKPELGLKYLERKRKKEFSPQVLVDHTSKGESINPEKKQSIADKLKNIL